MATVDACRIMNKLDNALLAAGMTKQSAALGISAHNGRLPREGN